MAGWKILLYTSLSKEMRLPSFSNQVSYKSTIFFWMLDDFTECNKWSVPYVYYTLSQLSWVWSLHHRVDRPFAGTPRKVSDLDRLEKTGDILNLRDSPKNTVVDFSMLPFQSGICQLSSWCFIDPLVLHKSQIHSTVITRLTAREYKDTGLVSNILKNFQPPPVLEGWTKHDCHPLRPGRLWASHGNS